MSMPSRLWTAGLGLNLLATLCACQMTGLNLSGKHSDAARLKALEERVARLDALTKPMQAGLEADARRQQLRARFMGRLEQDKKKFSPDQLRQIEGLYQVANQNWRSDEARKNLQRLIKEFPGNNRTGCGVLYLAQQSSGKEAEDYFKLAIEKYGDCFYGDGAQVGALARCWLGKAYQQQGKTADANKLFEELRKNYADAIDHQGNLIVNNL